MGANSFGWSEGQLRNTAATDWLADASADTDAQAMKARVAGQAKSWFASLPALVMSDRDEFRIQANDAGLRVSAAYDAQRDAAHRTFVSVAERMYRTAEEAEDKAPAEEDTSSEDAPAEDEEALFEEAPAEEETSEEDEEEEEEGEETSEEDAPTEDKADDKAEKEGRRRVARRRTASGMGHQMIAGEGATALKKLGGSAVFVSYSDDGTVIAAGTTARAVFVSPEANYGYTYEIDGMKGHWELSGNWTLHSPSPYEARRRRTARRKVADGSASISVYDFLAADPESGWGEPPDERVCAACGDLLRQRRDGKDTGVYSSLQTPDGMVWHEECFDALPKSERDTHYPSRTASRRRTARRRVGKVSLTNIRIEDRAERLFSGVDSSGKRVTFRASERDAADIYSVMFGDLAVNFSGLAVDEGDIVSTASRRRTAGRRKTSMDRNRPVKIHEFPAFDDEHLYAYTQTTEGVLDGDVFVGAEIGQVGFMLSYMPVVVSDYPGTGLHTLLPSFFSNPDDVAKYGESISIAIGEAKRLGLSLDEVVSEFANRTASRRRTAWRKTAAAVQWTKIERPFYGQVTGTPTTEYSANYHGMELDVVVQRRHRENGDPVAISGNVYLNGDSVFTEDYPVDSSNYERVLQQVMDETVALAEGWSDAPYWRVDLADSDRDPAEYL